MYLKDDLTPPEIHLDYHGIVMVFDLDDTLYPERDYMLSGFRAVAASVSSSPDFAVPAAECMREAADNGSNAMDALADRLRMPAGSERDAAIERWVETYRSHNPDISLPADSAETLAALSAAGLELALITDGRSAAQRAKISALGLRRYFAPDNIYISGERDHSKESMEPFAYMVHRYPEAGGFVYVGDNPAKDFLNPNLMGWQTICLRDKGGNIHSQNREVAEEYLPQHFIGSLRELITRYGRK